MSGDDLRRLDLLCFDERTETWFVDTREARRLVLNRQTLEGLLLLYNSVHRGNPLTLFDSRALHRIDERDQRLTETIRDLQVQVERRGRRRLYRFGRRLLGGLSRTLRIGGRRARKGITLG